VAYYVFWCQALGVGVVWAEDRSSYYSGAALTFFFSRGALAGTTRQRNDEEVSHATPKLTVTTHTFAWFLSGSVFIMYTHMHDKLN
jgi:hypothetical protein